MAKTNPLAAGSKITKAGRKGKSTAATKSTKATTKRARSKAAATDAATDTTKAAAPKAAPKRAKAKAKAKATTKRTKATATAPKRANASTYKREPGTRPRVDYDAKVVVNPKHEHREGTFYALVAKLARTPVTLNTLIGRVARDKALADVMPRSKLKGDAREAAIAVRVRDCYTRLGLLKAA